MPETRSEATRLLRRGVAAQQAGRLAEAERSYRAILAIEPDHFDAQHFLGLALFERGQTEEARRLIARALAVDGGFAPAHCHYGVVLAALGRPEEALASLDRALALRPADMKALFHRGDTLLRLGRNEEALADLDKALAGNADWPEALYDRGLALLALKRPQDALASTERALALRPDHVAALNNRGLALLRLSRPAEARASCDRALALVPDYAPALHNRGDALIALGRWEEAARDFERLLALEPEHDYALGSLVYARGYTCDWRDFERNAALIAAGIGAGRAVAMPFPLLAISNEPGDQLRCARLFMRRHYPPEPAPLCRRSPYRHAKPRLAYLSADFHDHATSYLAAELFERHDRGRFEVSAISFGPDSSSALRTRLRRAFDRFVEVREQSDRAVAQLLRAMEIDIAVDLKGLTQDGRPGILAFRPAPIQVNYLGYPGTMGVEYIDYLIADRWLIPEGSAEHYAEKIVLLPGSYQPNDRARPIAETAPTRAAMGLPPAGFVFCSFNNNYKITPALFDRWMNLLRCVGASVLWLLEGDPAAPGNLRREAEARGVAGARLVFAPRLPLADHLARHRLADLFLDTLPCTAHTTASDALWTGLPVLTCLGETFAGRVAASLLDAAGLPELITHSLDAYEALALALARDPEKLAGLKTRLAASRARAPLFDADRLRRHIEAAYLGMWQRHERGEPPAAFAIDPLD